MPTCAFSEGGRLMFVVPWLLAVLAQAPASGPVEVVGRVEGAKRQPVAEAQVWVSGRAPAGSRRDAEARATTDAQGRFRVTVPPPKDAQTSDLPWAVWATHASHGFGGQTFTRQSLAKANGEPLVVKLATPGGATVRVLGPDGGTVRGARVFPMMVRVDPPSGSVTRKTEFSAYPLPDELAERLAATTGPDGRGTIAAVAPGDLAGVVIEAPWLGRQLAVATAGSDGGFLFRLAPVGRLAGRIVVDDPSSLQGLKILFFTRSKAGGPDGSSARTEAVPDSSGRFEVHELSVGTLYITVQLPEKSTLKFDTPRSKSIEAGQLTEVMITEKKPEKTRTLAGRVVDAQGNPVAGAAVFQSGDAPARTETASDAEGRFSLSGVAEVSTFVFARAKGFRFAGRGVKAGVTDQALTLTRESERPAETIHTLVPPATPEQESAAVHRLIDAYAAKALEKGDTNGKVRVLEVLARVDPARTLELTEGKTLTEPFLKGMFRMRVAAALLESAPDEALAVAESIDDPAARAFALLKAVDALPATEKAKKQELLDRALISAKAAREPTGIRLVLTGQVAEHWLDMGLAEKGTALLREVQPDAEQLPNAAWPAYAKGAFAEELCQIDLDAALKLTKGLSDAREHDRHHVNIAHELAGKDPAAAERVLGMVKEPYQHDQCVVRVAYRMAPVDLGRARRLAATAVDPVMRGYALGMGALGLAEAKKTADATVLLREAMDTLGAAGDYGTSPTRSPCERATTCAALVAVAERIGPDLVSETFWRALSLRNPRRPDVVRDPSAFHDLGVGLLLARYDREVARSLVARHLGPDATMADLSGDRGLAFVATAVIDPAWAVQLIERLPDDPDHDARHTKNAGRLAAAAVLARHGEARWRFLQHNYAYLWVADTEDIAGDL
jgi:Carboxypeptidase regulatory-like domain